MKSYKETKKKLKFPTKNFLIKKIIKAIFWYQVHSQKITFDSFFKKM